jgi:glycerol kinase
MSKHILAIDQGTTSSRAIVFDDQSEIIGIAQQEFTQYFPEDGWVEHDPEEIWSSTVAVVEEVLATTGIPAEDISAIGITNQRETTLVWDRFTGEPIHRAIVWQDRRTADYCETLQAQGYEETVTEKTGLLLDPYFSGTKVKWLLDNVPGARQRAEKGDLVFGTVDSFLLWHLTGTQSHKTDATNASRTLLFNIHSQDWDDELLDKFGIPRSMMPQVCDCSDDFGSTTLFGAEIPITGIAGDQQAAMIGQCCFEEGMLKSTYGTGCFVILNTGDTPVRSRNKLLTTVGYRLDGKVTYGLEGSIFVAGAAVQWLRDGLGLIQHAAETEQIARDNPDAHGVYLVPAFTGLGAPHWDPNARGAILGLTRDSSVEDVVTATLQSVCFQTRDLINAMLDDGVDPSVIRVDGGMVANDWVAQQLSDIVQLPVDRPKIIETTALGVAYLAGLRVGVFDSMDVLTGRWQLEQRFDAEMDLERSNQLYDGWCTAVDRVRN